MKQSCTIGTDYLGLPDDEVSTTWDAGTPDYCPYYCQVEDDPDHPSKRLRCCGNCTHYIVVKEPSERVAGSHIDSVQEAPND